MKKRILSIWFDRLASNRIERKHATHAPLALIIRTCAYDQIYCLNTQASAQGIRRGMPLADARGLCRTLITYPAAPQRDTAFLTQLARWMGRYSPTIALDGPDGLIADITGVSHLFDGEKNLISDMVERLAQLGISAQSGIADNRAAAYALARYGGGIAPPGNPLAAIGTLPPKALRIDPHISQKLAQLGLHRIAQLHAIPRAALARRFGLTLTQHLDHILGLSHEPIVPVPAEPNFSARLSLPEPIGHMPVLLTAAARLLTQLCSKLKKHAYSAHDVSLELERVDQETITITLQFTHPVRAAVTMLNLLRHRLEQIDAGFGIDTLRVHVAHAAPTVSQQMQFDRGGQPDQRHRLINLLGNRIGFHAIYRHISMDNHMPEHSFACLSAKQPAPKNIHIDAIYERAISSPLRPISADTAPADREGGGAKRPLNLFPPEEIPGHHRDPPARFTWRGQPFTTARAMGPERLCPPWWDTAMCWNAHIRWPQWTEGARTRDYWKIETHQGPRLWLVKIPPHPRWFVHGEFA